MIVVLTLALVIHLLLTVAFLCRGQVIARVGSFLIICTRQNNEAREDENSEWDCVTEGNRKICIKHGAENGTR